MIFIPIENIAREGLYNYYLALMLVKENYRVCIGDQRIIQSLALYSGSKNLYIDKSLAKVKSNWYKKLPKNLSLISHDVEFTGTQYGQHFCDVRYSNEGVNRSAFTLFHNEYERSIVQKFKKVKSIDLLGSWSFNYSKNLSSDVESETIKEVKEKFGEFIFIPSNFGGYFRKEGQKEFLKWAKNHFRGNAYDKFMMRIEKRERSREKLISTIKEIAEKFKNEKFIIRPHPTEASSAWRSINFPKNVDIYSGFNASSMVSASKAVMHNGCTTAFDAYLKSKKQIFFYFSDDEYDWPFKDLCSFSSNKENCVKNFNEFLSSNSFSNAPIDLIPETQNFFEDFNKAVGEILSPDEEIFKESFKFRFISFIKSIRLKSSHKFLIENYETLLKNRKKMINLLDLDLKIRSYRNYEILESNK